MPDKKSDAGCPKAITVGSGGEGNGLGKRPFRDRLPLNGCSLEVNACRSYSKYRKRSVRSSIPERRPLPS